MDPDASVPGEPAPSVLNYVLSFLLVGVAWGFTTPFIRRAAADFNARQEKQQQSGTTPSDRGRLHTQSPVEPVLGSGEEEQELLPQYEQDQEGDGENVRRRSGSRQRQEEQEENTDNTPAPAWMHSSSPQRSWLRAKIISIFWTVVNLLRTPAYSIPLVINLTGSIWFFLLVGKHGMSLLVIFEAIGDIYIYVYILIRLICQNSPLLCHWPTRVRFCSRCLGSGMLSVRSLPRRRGWA